MKMKKRLFFLCVILFLNLCYGYFLCESPVGKLEQLKISGCSDLNETCYLLQNTNVTITMKFTPNKSCETVKFIPSAVLTKYNVDLKSLSDDACCTLKCPLLPNESQNYVTKLPIMGYYPPGLFLLQLELQNEDEVDIVCVGTFAEVKYG